MMALFVQVDDGHVEVPRLCMTAKEILDLAIEQEVLPRIDGHYELFGDRSNVYAPQVVIDIEETNRFFSGERSPGKAV